MADLQLYSASLNGIQALQLYLNNSVLGLRASNIWPLSTGAAGLMNQTINLVNVTNIGYISCTNANVINGACGVQFVQP